MNFFFGPGSLWRFFFIFYHSPCLVLSLNSRDNLWWTSIYSKHETWKQWIFIALHEILHSYTYIEFRRIKYYILKRNWNKILKVAAAINGKKKLIQLEWFWQIDSALKSAKKYNQSLLMFIPTYIPCQRHNQKKEKKFPTTIFLF